ncbi:MAG: fibronectin type III domain-containing protein [Candidatus Latescibacteria bacterium]|nr:fibronectin type III domain-containing protein [Candidatus Latescibacterota bacterium]
MIYHVDEDVDPANLDKSLFPSLGKNPYGSKDVNAFEEHKHVDVECADGLFASGIRNTATGKDDLDTWYSGASSNVGNIGDANDVWTSGEFTPYTNPSTDGYDGKGTDDYKDDTQTVFTGIAVKAITQNATDGSVSVKIRFLPSAPVVFSSSLPSQGTGNNWNKVTLSWGEPTLRPGSISGYEYSTDGDTSWSSTWDSDPTDDGTGTIEGTVALLKDDNTVNYTFQVRAVTAEGDKGDIAQWSLFTLDRPGAISLESSGDIATPTVGDVLTATLSDPNRGISDTDWTWWRRESPLVMWETIPSADGPNYTPMREDIVDQLQARVSYTDGLGPNKTAESMATGAVIGPPDAPDVSFSAGDGQVTLRWSASSDNGSPILHYEYQQRTSEGASGANGVDWTAVDGGTSADSLQVTGLTNGTPYTFWVRAVNAVGASDSTAVVVTPVGRPGAPTLTVAAGDGQVTWRWTAGVDNGSAFVQHQWRQSADGGASWSPDWTAQAANTEGVEQVVTGLTNGTAYTFQMRSENGVGYSDTTEVAATPQAAISGPESVSYAESRTDSVAAYTSPYKGVTWSLGTDQDESLFRIGTTTGVLTFNTAPNFEALGEDHPYMVDIIARYGTQMATQTVTVTVSNAEDAGTLALSSLQPLVGEVLTPTLTDEDGNIRDVEWEWYKVGKNFPREQAWRFFYEQMYTPRSSDVDFTFVLQARVSYRDGHGTVRDTVVSAWTAPVAAPPNRAPVIDPTAPATPTVNEHTTAVGTYTATDADNDAITWSKAGDDASHFTLGAQSGVLAFARLPNYEQPADADLDRMYAVAVVATDDGTPPLADTLAVSVRVTDADDPGTLELSSLTPQVGNPLRATLTDEDGPLVLKPNSLQWSLFYDTEGALATSQGLEEVSRILSVSTVHLGSRLLAKMYYTDRHGDQSAHSDTTAAVVGPPWKPQGLTATAGDGQVGLRWSAPVRTGGSSLVRYEYWYSGEGGVLWSPVAGGASVDSLTIGGLTNGQACTFAVRAVNQPFGAGAADSTTATLTDADGGIYGACWTWQRRTSATAAWVDLPSPCAEGAGEGEGASYPEGSSYTPQDADGGYQLRATVRYQDGHGTNQDTAASDPTGAVQANVPLEPQNLTATAQSDTSVHLTWDAPGSDGGSTITGYEHRWQPAGGSWTPWKSAGTSSQTVSGLTGNTQYTFEVWAENDQGPGDAAQDSTTTPKGNMDTPGSIRLSTTRPQVDKQMTATLTDPDGIVSSPILWFVHTPPAEGESAEDATAGR